MSTIDIKSLDELIAFIQSHIDYCQEQRKLGDFSEFTKGYNGAHVNILNAALKLKRNLEVKV